MCGYLIKPGRALVSYDESEGEEENKMEISSKREPLSLDELIAKKADEQARESKVRVWHFQHPSIQS